MRALPEAVGCGQDRGGVATGREGAAKTLGAQSGAVGVQPRPWGCGQGLGGNAKGCGGVAMAVGVRPGVVGV